MRRSILINRAWAAGEDYPLGFEVAYGFGLRIERVDFAIDPQFADSPRNQLSILRAEIENQNGLERNGHDVRGDKEIPKHINGVGDTHAPLLSSTISHS